MLSTKFCHKVIDSKLFGKNQIGHSLTLWRRSLLYFCWVQTKFPACFSSGIFCMVMCFCPTWSSLFVCRRRCLKKSKREHFLTRIRSAVPSARWAEGDRPLGLRGHAQLIFAALMAINFPWITLQPLLPSETEEPVVSVKPQLQIYYSAYFSLTPLKLKNCMWKHKLTY